MNGKKPKMNAQFNELYERLKASPKDWEKIRRVKKELSDLLTRAFQEDPSFVEHKYFGSTESGNMLKWERDIDCMVAFLPYDSERFLEGVRRIEGLHDLKIRKSPIVSDIAAGIYNGEKVGIIGLGYGKDATEDLEGDVWNHPEFSKGTLVPEQQREVVLGKIFFKVLGLSKKSIAGGFAVEQLITRYRTFENLLKVLATNQNIRVDFSGKYSGEENSFVISYPYCGLENLAKNFSPEDRAKVAEYASKILDNPQRFLEDAINGFNRYLWQQRAKEIGETKKFGSPDIHLTRKENRILRRELKSTSLRRILDVGCANGYSTLEISAGLDSEVIGIDNNEEVISIANKLGSDNPNVSFRVGTANNLQFEDSSFNAVIMKRTIGNIPSRDQQRKAIRECYRVLKPNGKLYLFDGILEDFERFSRIRRRFGLPEIVQPNHTYVLRKKELEEIIDPFELQRIVDQTGTYQVLTKIVYPFFHKFFGGNLNKLKFDTSFHNFAANLPSFDKRSLSRLYIYIKK
ncbi:MAG: methyltransferase domain-containing protein [archaeon]